MRNKESYNLLSKQEEKEEIRNSSIYSEIEYYPCFECGDIAEFFQIESTRCFCKEHCPKQIEVNLKELKNKYLAYSYKGELIKKFHSFIDINNRYYIVDGVLCIKDEYKDEDIFGIERDRTKERINFEDRILFPEEFEANYSYIEGGIDVEVNKESKEPAWFFEAFESYLK